MPFTANKITIAARQKSNNRCKRCQKVTYQGSNLNFASPEIKSKYSILLLIHAEKQPHCSLHEKCFEKVDDQVLHSQLIYERLVLGWSKEHARTAEDPQNYEQRELQQPLPSCKIIISLKSCKSITVLFQTLIGSLAQTRAAILKSCCVVAIPLVAWCRC